MQAKYFPVINPEATGRRISELRTARGLSVRDIQEYFGFDAPQAIYKWQKGISLPSVDNLLALSALLGVTMDEIVVRDKVSFSGTDGSGDVLFLAGARGRVYRPAQNIIILPARRRICAI